NRAYDSLTMSVAVGPELKLAHHAQLICNRDSPHKPPFGDAGAGIGRLLIPALQAGALAWLRLERVRHAFAAIVDGLCVGALVYDGGGRELHRNPGAARLLAAEPVARGLAELAGQLARSLVRPPRAFEPMPPCTARSGP